MKTPTIIKVSMEPFCPFCGGGLEMQVDTRTVYDTETDEFLGFALPCPWCGKTIPTSEVDWRERENGDINDRIALARGWTWHTEAMCYAQSNRVWVPDSYTHWTDPTDIIKECPDFVGTLEGVNGMLRELQEDQYRKEKALLRPPDVRLHWSWRYVPQEKVYACDLRNQSGYRHRGFESPDDRPSDCVGEAWMSVFGKDSEC